MDSLLNILTSPDNNEYGMVEQSDDILTDFFLKLGNELSNLKCTQNK